MIQKPWYQEEVKIQESGQKEMHSGFYQQGKKTQECMSVREGRYLKENSVYWKRWLCLKYISLILNTIYLQFGFG